MPDPRAEVASTPAELHGGTDGGSEPKADFSINSNPFGPPPQLLELLASVDVSRYPDPSAQAARRSAAELQRTKASRIALGAGTAELIHRLAASYLRPGDRVVVAAPTFGEYARASRLHGARVVLAHPYRGAEPDSSPLLRSIRSARPTLVWLCHPNNPTGHGWPSSALEHMAAACREVDALLIVDAAYLDLSTEPALGTGTASCLSLHSITKSFAIPGLRVGYACGPADVIAALEAVAPPWVASAHGQAALPWACGEAGNDFLRRTVPALLGLRNEFRRGLEAMGYSLEPSVSSFFLLRTEAGAGETCRRARASGFRLRDCASFGLPGHIRLATRSESDNRSLLEWLRV